MEQKFIEMAKVIFTSIDHYRESGRDDKFNIDSIAEYLQRQFLLQQTQCTTLRELLAQMLNDEKKQFDDFTKDYFERLKHAQAVASITDVMQKIDERQPVA